MPEEFTKLVLGKRIKAKNRPHSVKVINFSAISHFEYKMPRKGILGV